MLPRASLAGMCELRVHWSCSGDNWPIAGNLMNPSFSFFFLGCLSYCLDGDGASIMHMGALPVIASKAGKNFKHIIINNGAHDSVGGQPTSTHHFKVGDVARAVGYREVFEARTEEEIRDGFEKVTPR